MEKTNNATCNICGKSYHKCLSCRDSMKIQPWIMFTDTAEHYKVFQAIRGYNIGVYNRDEFKSKLANIDLSDLENYEDSVKALIKDVLKEENAIESIKVESVAVENMAVKKTTVSRKRNYKTEAE